jgi:thiamine biosynthesis protein ThiI
MKSIVVHYQEIALKGNNRPWFVARLARNLRSATKDVGVREVRVLMGRIELVVTPEADWATVRRRVAKVFGVANFAKAASAPLDVDAIAVAILRDLGDTQASSFRVVARRADKRFPLTSPQIEHEVGGRIKEARGWTVNLAHPELKIHVEALTDEAFYYFGKEPGAGGLPSGTSGRVACLLSGGIRFCRARHRRRRASWSNCSPSSSTTRVCSSSPSESCSNRSCSRSPRRCGS